VGHYWLRAPQLAPTKENRAELRAQWNRLKNRRRSARRKNQAAFRAAIHANAGDRDWRLGTPTDVVGDALAIPPRTGMAIHFIDNTDPDGIARALKR